MLSPIEELVKEKGWRIEEEKTANRRFVYPALQHGDFVPWHMFQIDDKTIGVVDGEHASLIKPRFYDLAYLYTRLYTKASSPDAAKKVLRLFLKTSGTKRGHFFRAFLPVATLRSFGVLFDSINDNRYQKEAQRLLDLCLEEDLSYFL